MKRKSNFHFSVHLSLLCTDTLFRNSIYQIVHLIIRGPSCYKKKKIFEGLLYLSFYQKYLNGAQSHKNVSPQSLGFFCSKQSLGSHAINWAWMSLAELIVQMRFSHICFAFSLASCFTRVRGKWAWPLVWLIYFGVFL